MMTEANDIYESPDRIMINPTVAEHVGLDHHIDLVHNMQCTTRKQKVVAKVVQCNNDTCQRKKQQCVSKNNRAIFKFNGMSPQEMKRLTGFDDVATYLKFILTVCGADTKLMTIQK